MDIVIALENAANTVDGLQPTERRRLIEEGVAAVASERTIVVTAKNLALVVVQRNARILGNQCAKDIR